MSQLRERRRYRPLLWSGGGSYYDTPSTPAEPPETPAQRPARRLAEFKPEEFGPLRSIGQGHGLILGRFLPPHRGHQMLIDFGRAYASQLTVLVCTRPDDPIPAELRLRWMHELFPDVQVLHVESAPLLTEEPPDEAFRTFWTTHIQKSVPGGVDYLFASEDYGWKMAEVLGVQFILVDQERAGVPVSATQIREDPLAHWEYLPACVRPYFLRRVCLLGPESTGKSTLSKQLAAHYQTVYVPEYARSLVTSRGSDWVPADVQQVARGQQATEDALARQANRVLFSDTDLIAVLLWSRRLYGQSPQWIEEEIERRTYDLYLVTTPDIPYVGHPDFNEPEERAAFFERCLSELDARGRPYVRLHGSREERFEQACFAVDGLLKIKR